MSEANASNRSVISSEVEIQGTIKTSGSIQIDGRVQGEIFSEGDVTLGKSGAVKGNLDVNSVSISGTVQGNISARDKIELKSTARVMGDIRAKRLTVEDGVTFVGKTEVNPTGGPIKSFDEDAKAEAPAKPKTGDDKPPVQK